MVKISLLIFGIIVSLIYNPIGKSNEPIKMEGECDQLGWFPESFGLKDHSIFSFSDDYYIVSNHIPGEQYFAYARSRDLCEWEELNPVLADRTAGEWDHRGIWSPYIIEREGIYYMYYTGVSDDFTQSIMLASSINPADPASWEPHGVVFQPNHQGMHWKAGSWADCRDPMVIEIDKLYHLYYTGQDTAGGIVGMATSKSPLGPWQDWGSVIASLPNGAMPESSSMTAFDGIYYLFYNDTSQGEVVRIGGSQAGPWSPPRRIYPGWAHEVWRDQSGNWLTSYLTDYSVTISSLVWDDFFSPAQPFIASEVYHQVIPSVYR
jgi:Glycosyl hydrolases family 43